MTNLEQSFCRRQFKPELLLTQHYSHSHGWRIHRIQHWEGRHVSFSSVLSGSPVLADAIAPPASAMLERPVVRQRYAVPPTVMRSILIVGMPTPTGTLWPSFPQTPMPSSRRR